MTIGAATEVIAAEGRIVTAGGIDTTFISFVRNKLSMHWQAASPP
jgi:urease alpha subunit